MKNSLKSLICFMSVFLFSYCSKETIPEVSTNSVTEVTAASATVRGEVLNDGGAPVISKGICWKISDDPTTDDDKTIAQGETGSFTSILSLSPGTTYYVRAYATNSAGTGYGASVKFRTLGEAPSIITQYASNLQMGSVTLNVNVNPNSLSTTIVFEWGTSASYLNKLTPLQSTVTGETPVSLSADLTGLTPGTTYHYRIVAKNELGTTASEDMIFTTLAPMSDIDGNTYNIRTLGKQVWMTENLKVTRYRNGDPVQHITSGSTWDQLTQGAYCNYNNDINNVTTYGRLYNGYAVLDKRGICPSGWHVPDNNDFNDLRIWIGGSSKGGKLKEAGTAHWTSPNVEATNETGFTALPAGQRTRQHFGSDGFDSIGLKAFFWQKEITSAEGHWWSLLNYLGYFGWEAIVTPNFDVLTFGRSIRCIKD